MNPAPSQPGNTFNSQPGGGGTQTNPFTQDLKGEFTSNFGTNTNAVSQIFKEGSFNGNNRNKYLLMGAFLLLLLVGGWYLLSDSESTDEETIGEEVATDEEKTATDATAAEEAAKAEEAKKAAEAAAAAAAAQAAQTATAPVAEAPVASAISLASPEDGASLQYDETQGSANFSWNGGPGTIVFSRHSSMQPEVMRVKVSGTSYSFHHPWPGKWYWKVESEGGASEPRSFTVNPPVRRSFTVTAPTSGGTLAGTGGVVSWTGDKGVAYYRVEMVQGDDWSNPQFKFSSSGAQVQLNAVPAGQYSMRLGAFSEVSGRWEYSDPMPVTVQ